MRLERARRAAHAHVDRRRAARRPARGCAGRFWNSSGTRSARSTTCSPATTSHSSAASAIDSDLQAEVAEADGTPSAERAPRLPRRAARPRRSADQLTAAASRSALGVDAALEVAVDRRARCVPVSSDTTIATASFSSVRPMRGAMPRAELAAQPRIDGQRQEAGGGRDAIALDDHRAVVQRRGRLEDADQQVVGELASSGMPLSM